MTLRFQEAIFDSESKKHKVRGLEVYLCPEDEMLSFSIYGAESEFEVLDDADLFKDDNFREIVLFQHLTDFNTQFLPLAAAIEGFSRDVGISK